MPKGNVKFKQSDLARAIRAVMQTGANLGVEISTDGTIRLIPVTGVTIQPPKSKVKPKTLF